MYCPSETVMLSIKKGLLVRVLCGPADSLDSKQTRLTAASGGVILHHRGLSHRLCRDQPRAQSRRGWGFRISLPAGYLHMGTGTSPGFPIDQEVILRCSGENGDKALNGTVNPSFHRPSDTKGILMG